MKVSYPVDRRVSVWVGNFASEDDLDKCIDIQVAKRLALPTHIESTSEFAYEQTPVPIRQLIEGFSGGKFFANEAAAKATAQGILSANSAFICYFVQCDDAPEQWGPLHFLGTFAGQLFT